MGRIRAVIFDIGGTLLYPLEKVGETYARFARRYGLELCAQETHAAFGLAFQKLARPRDQVPVDGEDRAWWRSIVRASIAPHAFEPAEEFDAYFEDLYLHFGKPEAWGLYPEVPEVLRELADRGYVLAVLSNWDSRVHPILDHYGLSDLLPLRYISAELGWEKPDPAFYRFVSEKMRLEPHQLLSVGDDTRNDVEGPRRVGWQAFQIERPKRDLWSVMRKLTLN